jgi:hypothetical protein
MLSNKFFIISVAMLISGCATLDKGPVRVEIQTVNVPIAIACKADTPAVPDYSFGQLKQSNTIFEKVRSLLADRVLSLGYETELVAALQSCK